MEKTLAELLYDLQCFKYRSLDLCRPMGNDLGDAQWRITWIGTTGGEQFRFCTVDYIGREGSGIYTPSRTEAEAYARQCVRNLFAKGTVFADPNTFDWHPRGLLAEV